MAAAGGNVVGYEAGDIPVRGAVTVELLLGVPGMPLQGFIDHQYLDSQVMDKRPGMYLKYLPHRYDEVTGKIWTGGSYTFDSWENAKENARWVGEDYEVGETKIKFLDQPLFETSKCLVWKVLGAHSFAPIEEHAVGRLQYWSYEAADAETTLRGQFDKLQSAAKDQNAAAFWLLFNPDEKLFGFQMAFKKAGGSDEPSARQALASAAGKSSLGSLLPDGLRAKPLFDRTSLLLTIWLPRSRAAGGRELLIPNHPVVPDITHKHL